jgi:DNA-binding NtrC family response regulator
VRLTDPEISRRHAALTVNPTHVQYVDLDSTNGSTVNGVIVKEVSLLGGEAIRIGGSVLMLKRGAAQPSPPEGPTGFGRLVGESRAISYVHALLRNLLKTDGPILLEGEAGTGKELVAEEVHRAGPRADGPFSVLEMSTISSEQVAARLFGSSEEAGLLETTRGGTLFIDEIADLPLHAQRRLRNFITATRDVRLIAATKHDLDRNVADARFDEQFFFELASGRVDLPPLRERHGDVELLARHFWAEATATIPGAPSELPLDFLPRFEHYAWPGNVRELRSVVRQRATTGELSKTYLTPRANGLRTDIVDAVIQEGLAYSDARDRVLFDFQRRYVEGALLRYGTAAAAARASGLAYRYFQIVRARSR